MRVAIVDDEEHARAAIRLLLESREGVEVVAECRNGLEAVEVLRWMTVDLLLLDVQMPALDGFGVLHAMGADRMPPTVFVTAFDEYAVRAFDVGAVDYVVKPFDESRFLAAFDKACRLIEEHRTAEWAKRLLAATRERATLGTMVALPRLPVPVGKRVVFVNFAEIDWIEAADQYVIIHAGTKEYLLRESLRRLAKKLPTDCFARIHRSHLVNIARVREVTRLTKGDAEVTLSNGRHLRVSRRYRRSLPALRPVRQPKGHEI
jgi:two-component system, LytTR family, response regulator